MRVIFAHFSVNPTDIMFLMIQHLMTASIITIAPFNGNKQVHIHLYLNIPLQFFSVLSSIVLHACVALQIAAEYKYIWIIWKYSICFFLLFFF